MNADVNMANCQGDSADYTNPSGKKTAHSLHPAHLSKSGASHTVVDGSAVGEHDAADTMDDSSSMDAGRTNNSPVNGGVSRSATR